MAHDLMRSTAAAGARRRAAAVIALSALALVASACGSPGAGAPSSTTTLPSPAASKAAITGSYETLFDLADPVVAPKLAVVEDGSALQATFTKELASPLAKSVAGARVTSVVLYLSGPSCASELLSKPCAKVTYDVLGLKGNSLLAGSIGWAVYSGGRWLVAKATICGLLSLASKTPLAGC